VPGSFLSKGLPAAVFSRDEICRWNEPFGAVEFEAGEVVQILKPRLVGEAVWELDGYLKRGGEVALIHSAVIADKEPERLADLCSRAPGRSGNPRVIHGFISWTSRIGPSLAKRRMWRYLPQHGKGRVFAGIPGHYSWTLDDPVFRPLLLRGIAWAAGRRADGHHELFRV
jgi:hypothetical protein